MMTETLVGVSPPMRAAKKTVGPSQVELDAARELVKAARDRGTELTGPDGMLKATTKTVLETALDEEMSEHLGYDKHAGEGRNHGNSRNGSGPLRLLIGLDLGDHPDRPLFNSGGYRRRVSPGITPTFPTIGVSGDAPAPR